MSDINKKNVGILSVALALSITVPAISNGNDTGHDWYCMEPAQYGQYEKHVTLHINHEAEAITRALDTVYTNPGLSVEQKHMQILDILRKHLSHDKKMAGVGD